MTSRGEKSKGQELEPPEASPKRGPTLSTSTSSFEALDPHDPQLNQLASVMFTSTSDWITGYTHLLLDHLDPWFFIHVV